MTEVVEIKPQTVATRAETLVDRINETGDLSKLTPAERNDYYRAVCDSVGLNAITRPLQYITLDGQLTLYVRKDAAEQLRKINGISCKILDRAVTDGVFVVHVLATDKLGRTDEDISAIPMVYPSRYYNKKRGQWQDHPKAGKPFDGLDKANALKKGVTQAKRRVTLSISGLGFMDEADAFAAKEREDEVASVAALPPIPDIPDITPPPAAPEPASVPEPEAVPDEAAFVAQLEEQVIVAARTSSDLIDEVADHNAETIRQCSPSARARIAEIFEHARS